MKRDKKDDEESGASGGGHPYANLEKTSVLQEARYTFHFLIRVGGLFFRLKMFVCTCQMSDCKKSDRRFDSI
jgi:hypothetical protein